jgi:RNA polymerase sigma factor (sigma-70 family)
MYAEFYNDLYHYGIKIIGNSDEVKDRIQDLFYKLWKNKGNLKQPENIRAYLLRGLRTIILDYIKVYKNRYKTSEISEDILFSLKTEPQYNPDESANELTGKLYYELEQLPARQKEAIYLHYIKETKYKEVAEIMNINIQSARNLVHEGLCKLKEKNF